MFVNEEFDNSKNNFAKMNLPLYYSPYIHKKKSIGNLYTEPRKIPIEKDSNSRNKSKQKANYSIKISNSNIKSQQDSLTKSLKLTSEKNNNNNKKGRNMHQSYVKLNTKLYLKKNAIPNLASFHDLNSNYPPTPLMKNSTTNIIISNSIKSTDNKNSNLSIGKNKNKNSNNNKNIKLIYSNNINNINNNINKNFNYNYNTYSNNNLLKKTAGSANELFRNNFVKKTKTKNTSELNNINNINNINQIGYIFTTSGPNPTSANKAFLSPRKSAVCMSTCAKDTHSLLCSSYMIPIVNALFLPLRSFCFYIISPRVCQFRAAKSSFTTAVFVQNQGILIFALSKVRMIPGHSFHPKRHLPALLRGPFHLICQLFP